MKGKEHFLVGLGTAVSLCILAKTQAPSDIVQITLGATVGSLFPDIDQPTSTIGRLTGPISKFVNKICGHREEFHCFCLYLYGLVALIILNKPPLETAFMAGALSHVIMDAFNYPGVPLFLFFKKPRLMLAKFKSDGFIAKALCFLTFIGLVFGSYYIKYYA